MTPHAALREALAHLTRAASATTYNGPFRKKVLR
jgi:hypothetical protein